MIQQPKSTSITSVASVAVDIRLAILTIESREVDPIEEVSKFTDSQEMIDIEEESDLSTYSWEPDNTQAIIAKADGSTQKCYICRIEFESSDSSSIINAINSAINYFSQPKYSISIYSMNTIELI